MILTKARLMKYLPTILFVAVLMAGLFLLPVDAFAQQAKAEKWACAGNKDINSIFCGITTQFRFLPKLLSLFAYVIAAVLIFKALFQLKELGDDPSKVPVQSIVIKFALAAALISLPLAMQLFVTTVTGAKDLNEAGAVAVRPQFGNGLSGH